MERRLLLLILLILWVKLVCVWRSLTGRRVLPGLLLLMGLWR